MVLKFAAKDKASPCLRGTNQQVVRNILRTQPNQQFYVMSLYNGLKCRAQFRIFISFNVLGFLTNFSKQVIGPALQNNLSIHFGFVSSSANLFTDHPVVS